MSSMNDYQPNLPLSPPKKILSKLTPIKSHNTISSHGSKNSIPTVRRSPIVDKKKRTLSASEVLDKASKFRQECELEIAKKQLLFNKKLQDATNNRNTVLEEKRQHAKRLSNDSRIWSNFKIKADNNTLYDVYDEYTIVITPETLQCDPFLECDSSIVIQRAIMNHITKNDIKEMKLVNNSLEHALKFDSWSKLIKLVNSEKLKSQIKTILDFYKAQELFADLPIENVFMYSIIMQTDHKINGGSNEAAYNTNLGSNAIKDFGGYELENFLEFKYHDDEFYNYMVSRFLRLSRQLLISFKSLIKFNSQLYDVKHLKFLKIWRRYLDLFHIFTNYHLKRSLLLILNAIDTLDSGIALQEQVGLKPEYSKKESFLKQKKMIERQIILNEKRNKTKLHNWFTLGYTFQERFEKLFKDYKNFTKPSKSLPSKFIIPPGFTRNEWRRFRFNRILRTYDNGKDISNMQTGIDSLKESYTSETNFEIEKEMSEIGLKPFRDYTENVSTKEELVELTKILFGAVGCTLSSKDKEIIEDYKKDDYIHQIQELLYKHAFHVQNKVYIGTTIPQFLIRWRIVMNYFTRNWVDKAIEDCPNYTEFENVFFKYDLARRNYSLEDFIDELKLEIDKPRNSIKTFQISLMEYIFQNKKDLSGLKSLDSIRDKLYPLINSPQLSEIKDSSMILYCLSETETHKRGLVNYYKFDTNKTNEILKRLARLKSILDIHIYTYTDIYKKIF